MPNIQRTNWAKRVLIQSTLLLALVMISTSALAQTSTFTYQGKLTDNGTPANAQYDFALTLWDAPANGTQVGSTLTLANTPVTDGIFTVMLNFGAAAFTGAPRYLEISVKPSGVVGAQPTLLSPRQQVLPTPYAIKSIGATSADSLSAACVNCVTSSQIASVNGSAVSGVIPVASVPAGSGNYIQNTSAQQASSNFNISGNGTAGGTLTGGTVNATTQYNLAGSRILSNAGVNNLFVGGNAGAANTGSNNSFFGSNAGQATTSGSLNAFFGSSAGQANTTGGNNTFVGYHAGINSTGNNNSFYGSGAGNNNSTGFSNAYFGYQAGFSSGVTNNNSFFGNNAGFSNSAGNNDSFFGSGAGGSNTSGNFNSFFGSGTGNSNTTGNRNSFFGGSLVSLNTTGSQNSFFGYNAGASNVTGLNNTLVGTNADVLTDGLNGATAIGYRAAVNQSNAVILGSVNGVNGANVNAKVGIGTTTPSEALTIQTDSSHYGMVHTNGDIVMGTYVGGTGAQPYGGWLGTKTNHPLSFFINNGSPTMMLDTSGFLRLNKVDTGGSDSICLGTFNRIAYCSSSLRYKSDVETFGGGLDVVTRLRPITFTWKTSGLRDVGFGAEEVARVEPLLTFRNPDGEIEGVKYGQITTVLVNAIKEQQAQIQQQQAQLTSQRKQLDDLRKVKADNVAFKAQLTALALRLERLESRKARRK